LHVNGPQAHATFGIDAFHAVGIQLSVGASCPTTTRSNEVLCLHWLCCFAPFVPSPASQGWQAFVVLRSVRFALAHHHVHGVHDCGGRKRHCAQPAPAPSSPSTPMRVVVAILQFAVKRFCP
jgi:hypothetical protein